MNITIRNIPDDVISRIRTFALTEKRSLNNEILFVLERGLEKQITSSFGRGRNINKETQISIWEKLSAKWEDDRTTEDIISDIYSNRTIGREIEL